MDKKGIILVISLVVIAILLVLTGAYFSGLFTEKRSADTEKFVLQALGLAEAGANQGLSELRDCMRCDNRTTLGTAWTCGDYVTNGINCLDCQAKAIHAAASPFEAYVTGNDPLGVLVTYAGFIRGNDAQGAFVSKAVSYLNLSSGVDGDYAASIIVRQNGSPSCLNPDGITVDPNCQFEIYSFPYKYDIDSTGTVRRTTHNIQKRIGLVGGTFTLSIRRDSFARFALFTDHHSMPSGTTVWFTDNTNFTGPVNTNTRFSFAGNPSAHFTEEVTQHETKARFYNNGSATLADSAHYPVCCEDPACPTTPCRDKPIFDKGFKRGQDLINLESTVQQSDLRKEALGSTSEPGPNGIYINNDGTNLTAGIYIKGNSTVNMGVDAGNLPVYTIVQGTTTKTVTVDYAANGGAGSTTIKTKVGSGSPTTATYIGIPDGTSEAGGPLIYAKNDITSFSGTVQQDTGATVSSERDIVITNNIQYQQYSTTPSLNAEGYKNVLGILSWGGNVRIGASAPPDIQIHGVIMAPHGIFTVDDYDHGSPRGTATLLGGAITDFYGPFGTFSGSSPTSGYGRNFIYDDRMLHGTTPPYFPYMTSFTASDNGTLDTTKLGWQDKGV
jgi:hypothetical protein